MIQRIRGSVAVKLFFSYLLVLLVGLGVLVIATEIAIPSAFQRHLGGMQQMMGGAGGPMPGRGPGAGMGQELYRGFRASFSEALTLAVVAALAAAGLVSLLVSRGIVRPLRAMMEASQRIADGKYSERVEARSADELGMLAHRFNQMAERLEQVETMRRQLIGDVAHELRTPLTSIKGSMEGLIDGVLPADAETFSQVQQEAERLSRLVDDLQELSRVEAGAYSLDRQPLEAGALFATLVKRLGPQFQAKGVTLDVQLPPDLPRVRADEDRLLQVLTNLLGNALQYTPAGGTVTLQALNVPEGLCFRVRDTGIGIPAEHLPHLFTRFYRVDKSRSRAGGGSGIGLTIAKHLVEAHGGRIWAESEGPGKGSTFSVILPVG